MPRIPNIPALEREIDLPAGWALNATNGSDDQVLYWATRPGGVTTGWSRDPQAVAAKARRMDAERDGDCSRANTKTSSTSDHQTPDDAMPNTTFVIPVEKVTDNPWQTRLSYDDAHIETLAADIAKNGQMQPVEGRLVRPDGEPLHPEGLSSQTSQQDVTRMLSAGAQLQLVYGHNRVRALRHLGRSHVRAVVKGWDDEAMARRAWAENAQRKDLTPIEEAKAIARRIEDFGYTQVEIAEMLGLGRSTVANKLRLLKLPEDVLQHVEAGELSERQALALLPAYQLSEEEVELIEWARQRWGVVRYAPDEVLKDAIDKRMPSDRLRQRVGWLQDALERYAKQRQEYQKREAGGDEHKEVTTDELRRHKVPSDADTIAGWVDRLREDGWSARQYDGQLIEEMQDVLRTIKGLLRDVDRRITYLHEQGQDDGEIDQLKRLGQQLRTMRGGITNWIDGVESGHLNQDLPEPDLSEQEARDIVGKIAYDAFRQVPTWALRVILYRYTNPHWNEDKREPFHMAREDLLHHMADDYARARSCAMLGVDRRREVVDYVRGLVGEPAPIGGDGTADAEPEVDATPAEAAHV